ncbi:MAG: hypothetical protein AAGC91_12150 [Pseudomonadota bacterium]
MTYAYELRGRDLLTMFDATHTTNTEAIVPITSDSGVSASSRNDEAAAEATDGIESVSQVRRGKRKSLAAFLKAIKFRAPRSSTAYFDKGFASLQSHVRSKSDLEEDGWVRSAN